MFACQKLPLPDKYSDGLRSTIASMLTKDPIDRPSAASILSKTVIQDFQRNPQRVREPRVFVGRGTVLLFFYGLDAESL